MDNGMMFGDLDLFLERSFFDEHEYGNLYFGGKQHGLHMFAMIEADAYDFTIYDTEVTEENQQEYLQHILDEAKFTRDIGVEEGDHIILLSTCAGGLTNLRYILACKLTDETYEDPFYEEPTAKEGLPFFLTLPWWWYAGAGLLVLLCILLWIHKKKRKAEADDSDDLTYENRERSEDDT
jgi:sortase B